MNPRTVLPAQMFDVGFAEIFLLALIGLIVLGPEKLPRVARTLGSLTRRARQSWYGLKQSIDAELAAAEVNETIRSASDSLEKSMNDLHGTLESAGELHEGEKPQGPAETKTPAAEEKPADD